MRRAGWYYDPGTEFSGRMRCSEHRPNVDGALDEGELSSLESAVSEGGVLLSGPMLSRLCEMARASIAEPDGTPAPYAASPPPVTAAEVEALAARVAKLEARAAHERANALDGHREFNLRCAVLGKRVRAALGVSRLHPTPSETHDLAERMLNQLGRWIYHPIREATASDCAVVIQGNGWPDNIIPAVARWLGFKNESALEDALAEDVLAAVKNGALA